MERCSGNADTVGFELFVTADQELGYQQNLTRRRLAILVLSTNNWAVIQAQFEMIRTSIEDAPQGSYTFVNIGHERG